MDICIKRVYEQAEPADGMRILVDRLWPRGISKEKAKIDLWFKEVTPSSDLRRWYHQDLSRWPEFRRRYIAELSANTAAVNELIGYGENGRVTLVYATKSLQQNHARVLLEFIQQAAP
ncbi:MAG: DUF488 domain-containing protein [Desulfopila sp.]